MKGSEPVFGVVGGAHRSRRHLICSPQRAHGGCEQQCREYHERRRRGRKVMASDIRRHPSAGHVPGGGARIEELKQRRFPGRQCLSSHAYRSDRDRSAITFEKISERLKGARSGSRPESSVSPDRVCNAATSGRTMYECGAPGRDHPLATLAAGRSRGGPSWSAGRCPFRVAPAAGRARRRTCGAAPAGRGRRRAPAPRSRGRGACRWRRFR